MTLATPIKTEEKKVYSCEEYLNLEEKSEEKHEYHNGEIIPMTGGTTNHNLLAGKFYALLLSLLNDEKYQVYIGDVRLWIEDYNRYTYPDVMVIKGEPIYQGKGQNIVTNPLLIVEVLSNSTKDYDHNDKFDSYRTLATFQEYLLVDQYQFYVKQFKKTEQNEWLLKDYRGENSIVQLSSLNLNISLNELYKKVKFDR